jgi:molybdopterin-guanine dinucleotide biosynthesis protein A
MAFGFVLVGGLSSRMGRDKTLLPVGGVPMAVLAARKLERVCGRAAFVGKSSEPWAGLGYPFVADGTEGRGALHGVVAALDFCPEEAALVLAADVPRVPDELLAALLALLVDTGAPAVVPTGCRHPQPLRAAVGAGDLSLRRAAAAAGALVLSEDESARLPGFAPDVFRNVNTPEEYRAVEEETA